MTISLYREQLIQNQHSSIVLGSSGRVIFTGLKGGRYILKIFAYNKLTDVATAKMVVNI